MPRHDQQTPVPDQILSLSRQEQQNPFVVIEDFFQCYYLNDVRVDLKEWFAVALAAECTIYDEARERSNLLHFSQKIEQLAEAAYLINEGRKKQKQEKKTPRRAK